MLYANAGFLPNLVRSSFTRYYLFGVIICSFGVDVYLIICRRGIGWHLLKASEELISQMSPSSEIYLHCRMIDAAPLAMYTKAGYNIVKTDNILVLLTLQRRKHLMCKKLPMADSFSEDSI